MLPLAVNLYQMNETQRTTEPAMTTTKTSPKTTTPAATFALFYVSGGGLRLTELFTVTGPDAIEVATIFSGRVVARDTMTRSNARKWWTRLVSESQATRVN